MSFPRPLPAKPGRAPGDPSPAARPGAPVRAARQGALATLMAGALVLAALMAGALAVSCSEGRFPVCKSNEECAARTGEGAGGKVCYNLKCVECAYDSDCPSGKACNGRLNVCESIGGAPASGDEGKESTEGPTTWDVNNWDECAKRCKDPDCIHVCDQRFKK